MLETLKQVDTQLLLFFNHLNNSFFDFIFFWISDKFIWIPFYLMLAFFFIRKFKSDFIWILVFVACVIVVSDQLASSVIKPLVMRLRPCHEPSILSKIHLVKGYCGGQFGFISSHAANTFALAAFATKVIPQSFKGFVPMMWIWASLVSFSRIYLGVHYPADVLVAALLGIVIGFFFAKLCLVCINKYSSKKV